jgi:hypothetical protein
LNVQPNAPSDLPFSTAGVNTAEVSELQLLAAVNLTAALSGADGCIL